MLLAAFACIPSTAAGQSPASSRPKSDAPGTSSGRKAVAGSKTPATPGAAAPAGKPAATAPAPEAPAKSLVGRISGFVVANAVWIIVAMVGAVALVFYFALRGEKRRSESSASEAQPLAPARPAAAEDGPRRVLVTPGSPKAPAPREGSGGEHEYALVVNEEDLKKPPLPEETARNHPRVTDGPLRDLLEKKKFEDAYRQYQKHLEENRGTEFATELESRLSDHFLRAGDLDKAGRILEHHVATHPGGQIAAETYFNLAYIHFKGKTLNKSRRYFRLFADTPQVDPGQVERARKLLSRLEKIQNLN